MENQGRVFFISPVFKCLKFCLLHLQYLTLNNISIIQLSCEFLVLFFSYDCVCATSALCNGLH